MKKLLLIMIGAIVVMSSGCVTLELGLNEAGVNIGLKGNMPDFQNFGYKKDLF